MCTKGCRELWEASPTLGDLDAQQLMMTKVWPGHPIDG